MLNHLFTKKVPRAMFLRVAVVAVAVLVVVGKEEGEETEKLHLHPSVMLVGDKVVNF